MDNLICKHWAGEMNPYNMEANPQEWFDIWLLEAVKTKALKHSLVVFRIPYNRLGLPDSDAIKEIELFLQKKFNSL